MKNLRIYLIPLLFVTIVVASCRNADKNTSTDTDSLSNMDTANHMMKTDTTSAEHAKANITNTKPDTTGSGTAEFTSKDGGVEMKLNLTFPAKANQSVAVHLHEHGDCGNAGQEAHGHWNPTNEPHGKWNSSAFHSGDIGNISLDAKGEGTLTLTSDRWTLGGDPKTNILNKAVIVHSGVDDYKTQPTGNAGSRIGCGIIMRE